MRASLDDDATTVRLDFDDDAALGSFAGDWRRTEGCMVELPRPLKLWTELSVDLRLGGSSRMTIEARVVQVFDAGTDRFATALQALDPTGLDELSAALRQPEAATASAEPDTDGPGEPAAGTTAGGETQGASPVFRIRRMNVSEKMRLATRATRSERQILLRDSSPQVLMGLLANPRIEDKEVLALAKSSSASSGVLQRIAKDRRWSTGYEIRLALVRNPQTPTPLALRMLDTLRERDLRMLAKGSMVREAIRGAALRKVIKR